MIAIAVILKEFPDVIAHISFFKNFKILIKLCSIHLTLDVKCLIQTKK
jgi:hypothetical protein